MEQSVYRNNDGGGPRRGAARRAIKEFFRETFRPHTREEYAEVFSRGFRENREGVAPRPWLYMRALVFCFILFGFVTLVFRLTGDYFEYPTFLVLGGIWFNLPLLIFFYELYPRRDFSLTLLVLVLLAGGLISVAISGLGYEFIYGRLFGFMGAGWLSLIFTGVWEELAKAIPVVIAALLLKKRDPFCCFLIGVAVGTGFSVYEDMAYVYSFSRTWFISSFDYRWGVLCALGRGFACVCSHAPWTAVIGWAFGRWGLKNVRLYGVALLSMFLHYWADVPFYCTEVLWSRGGVVIWIIGIAVIFGEMFLMIRASRRELGCDAPPAEGRLGLSQKANITGTAAAALVSLLVFVFCALPAGFEYEILNFQTTQDFVSYMQTGLSLSADWGRVYDEETPDYAQFVRGGELLNAVQEVQEGDYTYYYFYSFSSAQTEEGGEEVNIYLTNIGVAVEGSLYYCRRHYFYDEVETSWYDYGYPTSANWVVLPPVVEEDPEEPEEPEEPAEPEQPEEPEEPVEPVEPPVLTEVVSYYAVNEIRSYYYSYSERCYVVVTGEQVYRGLAGQIAVAVLAGAAFAGGAVAFVIMKRKAYKEGI